MPQFRKRPVVIEAVQWFEGTYNPAVVRGWRRVSDGAVGPLGGQSPDRSSLRLEPVSVIHTKEGWSVVADGDYIITGSLGEVYPCKTDIFALTYEPADEENPALPVAARELIAEVKRVAGDTSDGLTEIVRTARGFCNQMAAVEADSRWQNVWTMYTVHGFRYAGPFFDKELQALRDALRRLEWMNL